MVPQPVPTLIEKPPKFEFRDGMFIATDDAAEVSRAYRPHTFFATLAAMAQCARKYRLSSGDVLPFKQPEAAT